MAGTSRNLHDVCLARLRKDGASAEQVQAWETAWSAANQGTPGALPCPVCSMKGDDGRLVAQPGAPRSPMARCKHCGTRFAFGA